MYLSTFVYLSSCSYCSQIFTGHTIYLILDLKLGVRIKEVTRYLENKLLVLILRNSFLYTFLNPCYW